jgi:hypothetical protein
MKGVRLSWRELCCSGGLGERGTLLSVSCSGEKEQEK